MAHDPIIVQRGSELIPKLAQHGWRVIAQHTDDLPWWLAAVWEIESICPPRRGRVFLSFLADPEDQAVVWALVASRERLRDRFGLHELLIPVRRAWHKELPAFLHALDRLREPAES